MRPWSQKLGQLGLRRAFSTNTELIRPILVDIRRIFPDKFDLHARIKLAIDDGSITKIAIIPFHTHRNNIRNLLETLISDPLASDQTCFKALHSRMLSKDSLITYSPDYSYIKVSNTLNEYPISFRIPPHSAQADASKYQFIEINSWEESKKRVLDCHVHVFVSKNNAQLALTSPVPSSYPSIVIIDDKSLAGSRLGGNVITVDTDSAMTANELLAESPSNASLYTNKLAESNIEEVQERLFQPMDIMRHRMLFSIYNTCKSCITPRTADDFDELNNLTDEEANNIRKLRERWAKNAHAELQSTLSDSLDALLYSKLAWWKLYYKVDDIGDITFGILSQNFLPHSKSTLDYLVGRIDAFADKNYDMAASELKAPVSDELSVHAIRDVINYADDLHNNGLKTLTVSVFGIQLPCIIIPLLGWYFFDYSFYSMASIIAFGTVFSLRNLQKAWFKAAAKFKALTVQRAREALSKCENNIWSRWESKVASQQSVIKDRSELTRKLETYLHDTT